MAKRACLWGRMESCGRLVIGLLAAECNLCDTVRAPNVSFVRAERVAALDLKKRFEYAPDLAVEIISPSETAKEKRLQQSE